MHSIRKPRVFLSHSKKDVDFIRKLDSDLRGAQCDPWIDEIELRSGQPWLDQLFGSGIPSCEVVLCYITANSIDSAVFKQEMDARLLERLQNARVSLLLYVSDPNLRPRLRLDLQRLQVPELNAENYTNAFPRVVAEVWRCYAESLVLSSVESERVHRLEAELRVKELETNASGTVFTASENAEFTTIWSRLNYRTGLIAAIKRKAKYKPEAGELVPEPGPPHPLEGVKHAFNVNVGALFRACVLPQKFQPSRAALQERIEHDVLLHLGLAQEEFSVSIEMPLDMDGELLKYGFVQRQYAPAIASDNKFARMMHDPFKLMFTSKFDRFAFWVDYSFGSYEPLATVVLPE